MRNDFFLAHVIRIVASVVRRQQFVPPVVGPQRPRLRRVQNTPQSLSPAAHRHMSGRRNQGNHEALSQLLETVRGLEAQLQVRGSSGQQGVIRQQAERIASLQHALTNVLQRQLGATAAAGGDYDQSAAWAEELKRVALRGVGGSRDGPRPWAREEQRRQVEPEASRSARAERQQAYWEGRSASARPGFDDFVNDWEEIYRASSATAGATCGTPYSTQPALLNGFLALQEPALGAGFGTRSPATDANSLPASVAVPLSRWL